MCYLEEEDEEVQAACGHWEEPRFIEAGLCGACADEAVDRAQQRQIDRFEGH